MLLTQPRSPVVAVAVGLLGLAAAIGIGRFAFTPLMPLMQAHSDLSLAQGGWLAAANYAGYLAGALLCVAAKPNPGTAARAGLAGVALSTLAMGLTADFQWGLAWRFVAGVTSAFVLVGISAWALPRLARAERAHWAGWVFAGVGVGIMFAGLVSLVLAVRGTRPSTGWLLLADPAIFGWTWPVFGLAAAVSTVVASLLLRNAAPRRVWAIGQVVMAAGVVAPVMAAGAGMLLFAAIALGGTFMILTMAGMQEAGRVAGNGAPRLIAAMTAAFAIGQLLGPIVVGLVSSNGRALYTTSIAAAVLLIASAVILTASYRPNGALSNT